MLVSHKIRVMLWLATLWYVVALGQSVDYSAVQDLDTDGGFRIVVAIAEDVPYDAGMGDHIRV